MSGHGGSRRGRRTRWHDRGEEHGDGGHERWMITYADMLTLLLVLFIVMYAMSQVTKTKFEVLKSSLASAFHNGQPSILSAGSGLAPAGSSNNSPNAGQAVNQPIAAAAAAQNPSTLYVPVYDVSNADAAKKEYDEFKKIRDDVSNTLTAKGLSSNAQYAIDQRGLVITIVTDELVFGGNSAVLEPHGTDIIDAVIPSLKTIDNQIQIDGHTNQAAVSTDPYPSGWELSSARASSVVRYLVSKGFSPARLSAVGYSDQRPLVDPNNPLSITRNRRVDIVVLSKYSAAAVPQLNQTGGN